jgi:hypothetical protein
MALRNCGFVGALVFASIQVAGAQEPLCRDVVNVIDHPANTFVSKIKKNGVKCFVFPDCCTGAWTGNAACYVLNKTLVPPWQEIQHVTKCTPQVMTAVQEIAIERTNPTTAVVPPEIYDLFRAYLDVTRTSASPLPPDVKAGLQRIVGMPGIVWAQKDLDDAVYVSASDIRGQPLFPATYKLGGHDGITYGTLIVVKDSVLADKTCYRYETFAHELTHVFQNRQYGENRFLAKYILDATRYSYTQIPFEAEAFALQGYVANHYCSLIMGVPEPPQPPPPPPRRITRGGGAKD